MDKTENTFDFEKHLDCDYYSIEEVSGEKMVHIDGHYYCAGNSCTDNPSEIYRHVSVVWLFFPLADFLKMDKDTIWDMASSYTQYIDDLTEEQVKDEMQHYFNGKPGSVLPYSALTMDTPCGDYIAA